MISYKLFELRYDHSRKFVTLGIIHMAALHIMSIIFITIGTIKETDAKKWKSRILDRHSSNIVLDIILSLNNRLSSRPILV